MGNMRNTVVYFKHQADATTAIEPTSATDSYFTAEKPDITTGQKEVLSSEELSSSIGFKKPQLGLETATASLTWEMRSHGDSSNPSEPDFGAIFETAIGTPNTSTAEAVEAAPAPSTTEFGISTEGNLKKYDFFIIDNATDGRVARFVKEMKVDIVTGVNDAIDFNEGAGELNATLAAGTYIHGGSAVVGSIGEQIKTQLDATGLDTYTVTADEQSDGSYKYTVASDGTTFSLLIDSGTNAATNWPELNGGFGSADLTGALTYTAASAIWGNRVVCNQAMTTAPTAADVVSASVNYKPINTSHKHGTFGAYNGNDSTDGYFEQVIGCLVSSLGVSVETGALAKFTAELAGLKGDRTANTQSTYTPTFSDPQGLVGFCVEAYLDSTQVDANALNLSIEGDISEKQSFKECSGKIGSICRSRSITGDINPFSDGTVTYFDALNNLTDFELFVVIGKRDSGGFIVGKTVGFYLPQMMFTQTKTSDIDDNIIEEINFQAHTGESGNEVDIVVSFA